MKKPDARRISVLLCLALLLVVGLILWVTNRLHDSRRNGDSPESVTGLPASHTSSTPSVVTPAGLSDTQLPPPVTFPTANGVIRPAAQALNVPVEFWGKVVDQNSNAVHQAEITAKVRRWTGSGTSVRPDFSSFRPLSDAAGLFRITGAEGDSLRIESIVKNGYVLSPRAQTSFGYNISKNHVPDSGNPVVFRLWKKGPSEQLISHRLSRLGIPSDGTAHHFDLLAGKRVPSQGDLRVTFNRKPLILTSPGERHDWVVALEIQKGGLLLSSDEFLLAAPQGLYEKQMRFDMSKEDLNWTTVLKRQFYIQIRDGLFGRLSLSLSTDHPQPTGSLTLEFSINPRGGQSLEGGLKPAANGNLIE